MMCAKPRKRVPHTQMIPALVTGRGSDLVAPTVPRRDSNPRYRLERAIRLSLAMHGQALKCWKQRALALGNVDAHRSFTAGMCTQCVPVKDPVSLPSHP
jgi:hypothetical protein